MREVLLDLALEVAATVLVLHVVVVQAVPLVERQHERAAARVVEEREVGGVHEVRVVPLDGRPHVSGVLRSYMGDSRGRWEGDTLVVETTNMNGKVGLTRNGNTTPASERMRMVERFTRVADDTLQYEVTIDDPVVWTRPWTASLPLRLHPEYDMFEYACHEGNYGMYGILSGARALDRAAAEAAKKGSR